jgi:glucosamine--fructose-6-phosphate aminotransferase (isomerizing)
MENNGKHTREEILSQPQVWASALRSLEHETGRIAGFLQQGRYDSILFTGCGSTYYLSIAAAGAWRELTGLDARALPASEIWLNPSTTQPARGRTLLVAVSRSGETTETLQACQAFRARRQGDILTVSCYPGAPLTGIGDLNLLFPDSREESFAQTRSFSTLYIACLATAAIQAGKAEDLAQMAALPERCEHLIHTYQNFALNLGRDPRFERFYYLGSGLRYGLACELSLKMKEMSLSHSEPFHVLEFRHGPMTMANEQALIVGFLSEANRKAEQAVLDEMTRLGAETLSLGNAETRVAFATGLPEVLYSPLVLPVGQLLAYSHAISRDLNPDAQEKLKAVIRLDAG